MKRINNCSCMVLMSTYNGGKYISEQINSIMNQKDVDVTLFVRDDGSSDSTIEILNKFVKEHPNKIIIETGPNVGIHRSFAWLMNNLDYMCDYYAFSDQDDVWDSNKLICAISELQSNNADFYSSSSRLVDSSLNDLNRSTTNIAKEKHYMNTHSALLTPGTQGCTIVITSEFMQTLSNCGIPDYYGHDTWITVVAYYLKKCVYDPVPHMHYRQHNDSWTGNRKNKMKQLIRDFNFLIKGMDRYSMLAADLLNRFANEFSSYDKRVLTLMSQRKRSIRDRIALIVNFDFSKYGFFQNIILKYFILIGKV